MTASTSSQHHRRIDLQSPQDLTYLHSNLLRAASTKIDLHLPPNPASTNDEDDLRRRVQALTQTFLTDTFAAVKQNSSVNGVSFSDLPPSSRGVDGGDEEEEMEAHSIKLAEKCRALAEELEQEVLELAEMRRSVPEKWAGAWRGRLEGVLAEEGKGESGEVQADRVEEEVKEAMAEGVKLERQDEVARTFAGAEKGLGSLGEGLTGLRAKLERAGEVAAYVEGSEGRL